MPDEDRIRAIIREEIADRLASIDQKFDAITNTLTTGLDGKPGLIQNQRENHRRLVDLEKAEATRNRTVWAAIVAVFSAIAHTIWQFISGISTP